MPRSAQSTRARSNQVKPDSGTRGSTASDISKPPRRAEIRGYLRGSSRAAKYLDIDRSTFRDWRDDIEMAHRELLKPRIIRGDPYYRITNLDRFMDPENNPPGATIIDHFPKSEN